MSRAASPKNKHGSMTLTQSDTASELSEAEAGDVVVAVDEASTEALKEATTPDHRGTPGLLLLAEDPHIESFLCAAKSTPMSPVDVVEVIEVAEAPCEAAL